MIPELEKCFKRMWDMVDQKIEKEVVGRIKIVEEGRNEKMNRDDIKKNHFVQLGKLHRGLGSLVRRWGVSWT